MAIQIKLKNSVVQDSTPDTNDLPAVGEIALNANINSIGGFMRASDNSIVKIFGPGSLSTPTATTTVSGISELATNSETTTGTATNRVVTPAGLNAVTVAERTTSNTNYVAKAGSTLTGVLTMPNGSNSAPAINFGDSDSGIFGGTNTVSLTAGGTTRLTADTGVSVVGTLAVTGAITSTSDLTIADKIIHSGDTDTAIRFPAGNIVSVETGGSEALRVDSTGRVFVGTSSGTVGGFLPKLFVERADSTASIGIFRSAASNFGPFLLLGKSRASSLGGSTIVQDDDRLGQIAFFGADGTDRNTQAAEIKAEVDGTPGADDMPGRLVFATTADGAASPTERLRITNNGRISIGNAGNNASPSALLQVKADDGEAADLYVGQFINLEATAGQSYGVSIQAGSNSTDHGLRVKNRANDATHFLVRGDGNVGIGTASPSEKLDVEGTIECLNELRSKTGNDLKLNAGSANRDIFLQVNDSTLMTVQGSSGNVGIGTASPSGLLHISGNTCQMHFTDADDSSSSRIYMSGATFAIDADHGDSKANTVLAFRVDDSERMRIDSAGRLFVGTTSTTLGNSGVFGEINLRGGTEGAAIHMADNNGNVHAGFFTTDNTNYFVIRTTTNHPMAFRTNNTERMRIDSSGRLLLGTTTEGSSSGDNLTIADSGNMGLTLRSTDSNYCNIYFSDATSGTAEYAGYVSYSHQNDSLEFATASTERMRINSSGNVGIGTTSPNQKLHVSSGGINLDDGWNTQWGGNTDRAYIQGTSGASGNLLLGINNTERMRIDSSGQVGIGTTSPAAKLGIGDTGNDGGLSELIKLGNDSSGSGTGCQINMGASSGNSSTSGCIAGFFDGTGTAVSILTSAAYASSGAVERFRVDSSGNVYFGVTSTPNGSSVGGSAFIVEDNNREVLYLATTGGTETLVRFHNSNGQVGVISVSGSSTSYVTSSDYRLKENATAISDGITRLKTLKPYRFNWKADASTTVDGFFAHEVTAVPEAITGTKDEVDSDNNPVYQGIDQSKLVPLLVAAVQELIGKVEALEAA